MEQENPEPVEQQQNIVVVGQPVNPPPDTSIAFVHDPAHGVDPALDGGGLLLAAARQGDVAQVQAQLAKGTPVDVCHAHSCHRTALIIAAMQGHEDVVRILLEAGANRDLRDSAHRQTALGWAQIKGHAAVTELLMAD